MNRGWAQTRQKKIIVGTVSALSLGSLALVFGVAFAKQGGGFVVGDELPELTYQEQRLQELKNTAALLAENRSGRDGSGSAASGSSRTPMPGEVLPSYEGAGVFLEQWQGELPQGAGQQNGIAYAQGLVVGDYGQRSGGAYTSAAQSRSLSMASSIGGGVMTGQAGGSLFEGTSAQKSAPVAARNAAEIDPLADEDISSFLGDDERASDSSSTFDDPCAGPGLVVSPCVRETATFLLAGINLEEPCPPGLNVSPCLTSPTPAPPEVVTPTRSFFFRANGGGNGGSNGGSNGGGNGGSSDRNGGSNGGGNGGGNGGSFNAPPPPVVSVPVPASLLLLAAGLVFLRRR